MRAIGGFLLLAILIPFGGCFALVADAPEGVLDGGSNDVSAPADRTMFADASDDACDAGGDSSDAGADFGDVASDSGDVGSNSDDAGTDFFVDPDASSTATSFPTIALALHAVVSPSTRIHIAVGTYTAQTGESFPMILPRGTSLLGAGIGATNIVGSGSYAVAGPLVPSTDATIVVGDPVVPSSISGLSLSPGNTADTGTQAIVCTAGNAPVDGGVPPEPNLTINAIDVEQFNVGLRLSVAPTGGGCNAIVTASRFASGAVGILAGGVGAYVAVAVGNGLPDGGNTFTGLSSNSETSPIQWNGAGVWSFGAVIGTVAGNTFTEGDMGIYARLGGETVPVTLAIDGNEFQKLFNGGIVIEGSVEISELLNNSFQAISTLLYPAPAPGWLAAGLILDSKGASTLPFVKRARGNDFLGNQAGLILRGAGAVSPVSDFGTSADLGGNTFRCNSSSVDYEDGPGGNVLLTPTPPSGALVTIPFEGNIWDHAPPEVETSPTGYTAGIDIVAYGAQADAANATASSSPCPLVP